jgi:hypothetical protein
MGKILKIIRRCFSVMAMIGCLVAIALGFISKQDAIAYSFASLLFFALSIALSLFN